MEGVGRAWCGICSASGGDFILALHGRAHHAGRQRKHASSGFLDFTSHSCQHGGPTIITSQRPQLQVLLVNKSWKCWIHELRWATLKPPHRVWLRQELGFGVGFGNIPHMLLIVRSVLAMGPVASGLLGVRGRICLNRTYICA